MISFLESSGNIQKRSVRNQKADQGLPGAGVGDRQAQEGLPLSVGFAGGRVLEIAGNVLETVVVMVT